MCTGLTEGTQAVFVLLGVAGVWEVPGSGLLFRAAGGGGGGGS